MYAYSVYGLRLQSEFPIPELLPDPSSAATDAGSADVLVRLGTIPKHWDAAPSDDAARGSAARSGGPGAIDDDDQESWAERRPESNETLCVFAGVGRYLVQAGHGVTVESEPGVDAAITRHVLLGPVLAHLLWQRDVFTLHASVIGIHGRYAAFVGVSGEGKSTTAAALEARGHGLVCDDIAALTERDGRLHVLPAFPRMRLYADSVHSVGDDPERHPFVHPLIDKRLKPVTRFVAEAVPLERVYVLATGPQLSIERLPAQSALIEVLRHTYYALQYAPLYGFKQQMQRAAALVGQLPFYRLTRPKDLARLPELVGLLEARAAD